jgi:PP-loop superfamily ATP-utilizing enzyme
MPTIVENIKCNISIKDCFIFDAASKDYCKNFNELEHRCYLCKKMIEVIYANDKV